tara:strand:- start:1836 stop:1961 length:126 start_codon:yes stop_codon:yes gene_type:complete
MENIDYALIGSIFMSIMFTKFIWDLQGWVEKWIDKIKKIIK